ncbi:MAG: GDP-L-fucose synthase [Gammaproteobacteria bacterium]|jgi:GDP-L-fucose synthase
MKTEPDFDLRGKRIWVAGHRGMVGSSICRRLAIEDCELVTVGRETLDLTRQIQVEEWLAENKPDAVFVAAAKVGGIFANETLPGEFIYSNLAIQTHVIDAAYRCGVEKLMFLGSSCIYPKFAPQPMAEDALLSGDLEPTNQWYAIAKIAGIKMCQAYRRQYGCDFVSAMPTNLYGPGDNFDLQTSHVVPALMAKAHQAQATNAPKMQVWGTGAVKREFLHVDDLADAVVHLMKVYSGDVHVNIGTGQDVTIRELAEIICEVVGYKGELAFDSSKPDGTPRKLLDVSKLTGLGWQARTSLRDGLADNYRWYLEHVA